MKTCKKGHEYSSELRQCKICKNARQRVSDARNKKSKAVKNKICYEKNKLSILTKQKINYKKNQKIKAEKVKQYYKNNKVKIGLRRKNYEKERLKKDIVFKLTRNLRFRTWYALKNNQKAGSAVKDLGCTGAELKNYLESKFQPGMTWDNYGIKKNQWSIDHIFPLSRVDLTNREEFLKASHYTNLQPMWHDLNIKKSNKI